MVLLATSRHRARRSRVDHAAHRMGRGRDVEAPTRKHATATAQRLGVDGSAGVPYGPQELVIHAMPARRRYLDLLP